MQNVIAYIRVSTDNQAKENKFGLEAQKEQISAYAADHDMKVVRWVEDKGESGAKERPGLDEIVFGEATNPPYDAVLVAKSDRIAREINLYFFYKYKLLKKEIKLISISEDFGSAGSLAPIMEALIVSWAQIDRENINKRTSAGRKIKASKGGYSGGRAPMGYKVIDGRLEINEEEAKVVRFIFDRKANGESMLSTVDALNKSGYKTRNGKPFVISTVQSIWNNENTYRGMYKYGKDMNWVKGIHEPILKETAQKRNSTANEISDRLCNKVFGTTIKLSDIGEDYKED